MQLEALASQLGSLQQQALDALSLAAHREDAIQIKNRFLGRKGQVAELMQLMRELSNADKPQAGQLFNQCKDAIEAAYDARMAALDAAELERRLAAEAIDVTLPAAPLSPRPAHPLRLIEEQVCAIFTEMGFEVAEGPEIELDLYNFEMLNFPADHPARDMQDTFMLHDGRLLRTHTSPVQVRSMLAYAPPVRVISPGRVYRVDSDTTHSPVFHQVEGLLVGEGVTFANLKATLAHFAERCFGPGTPIRFRASFFPFTEPSAEVDVGCIFCAQQGCRVCKQTGWLEIMGCGMVDPNVLSAAGIDPERFTGFAFGMGVERIAMLKLRVNDIRLFYENNLRFLEQFA
jgi:phenylalanyl-tRNA synthetase alpha chain